MSPHCVPPGKIWKSLCVAVVVVERVPCFGWTTRSPCKCMTRLCFGHRRCRPLIFFFLQQITGKAGRWWRVFGPQSIGLFKFSVKIVLFTNILLLATLWHPHPGPRTLALEYLRILVVAQQSRSNKWSTHWAPLVGHLLLNGWLVIAMAMAIAMVVVVALFRPLSLLFSQFRHRKLLSWLDWIGWYPDRSILLCSALISTSLACCVFMSRKTQTVC